MVVLCALTNSLQMEYNGSMPCHASKHSKSFYASAYCLLVSTQGLDFTNKLFITVGIFYLNKNEIYSRLIKYAADYNRELFDMLYLCALSLRMRSVFFNASGCVSAIAVAVAILVVVVGISTLYTDFIWLVWLWWINNIITLTKILTSAETVADEEQR